MATYDFGDIYDCRKAPQGHFILVLGKNQKDEVMYYMITSRVYKVFKDILLFFNDCIEKKYQRFFHHFNKEKEKEYISATGNLCDAFFLDKYTNYPGQLDADSMVLLNGDPDLLDKQVFDRFRQGKIATFSTRLEKNDTEKFIKAIRLTDNISPNQKSEIGRNYNLWRRSV
ncbi:MAG: hypothetical protein WC495_01590 [Patescibacteria group bacterium]|jgi:hypothetical protein